MDSLDRAQISHVNSAVVWRKVLLVLFMFFELGPYLESLWRGKPSESIRCWVKAFFHHKNWLWSFQPKKWEKSSWCKKHLQFWFGRKVLMVPFLFQISTMRTFLQNTHKAPLGLFYFILKCAQRGHLSRSEELHLYEFSPSFHNLHH